MIYVEPVLILALVLWLGRGAPRPPRLTAAALVVPAALLTAIPFERLFNVSIFSDTTGLLPLFRVSALVDGGTDGMRVLLVLGAVAVCVFAALAPRRVLIVGSLAGIALSSGYRPTMSSAPSAVRPSPRGPRPGSRIGSWIDEADPRRQVGGAALHVRARGRRACGMADGDLEPCG